SPAPRAKQGRRIPKPQHLVEASFWGDDLWIGLDRTQELSFAVTPTWKRGSSLTSEQLEAARSERMRQNGNGALTLEEARTWMEETALCLLLPRRQFSSSLASSFVA